MNIFNRKELITVIDLQQQITISQTLKDNHITYHIKVISRDDYMRGTVGSYHPELSRTYTFYVHKKDYEDAKNILHIS